MQGSNNNNDLILRLLVYFLCAGSSALFLSIINQYPEFWFISMFALVPFLWRVIKETLSGSIILSVILAGCYVFIAYSHEIVVYPSTFLFKFICINFIVSVFGIAVNRINRYLGFNPIFIAALWLPLEYGLTHYAGFETIFAFTQSGSGFVLRLASLFGFLIVSFCVILINSLILMLFEHAYSKGCSNSKFRFSKEKLHYLHFENIVPFKSWYYVLNPRAPPLRIYRFNLLFDYF